MKTPSRAKVAIKSKYKLQRKLAIVISLFNEKISRNLLSGALEELQAQGYDKKQIDVFEVAGAFEIPLIALKALQTGKYEGVVALGCVIRGDTPHFDYVCKAVTDGCVMVQLQTGLPLAFGVITVDSIKQAKVRSGEDKHNKGRECVLALIDSLVTLQKVA